MNTPQIYIAVSIVVLAFIAILFFFANKNKKEKRLTPLAGLAFGFILAGIFFGDNRLIGYGLMGVGVLLAIVDIFNKSKNK
jgi:hypothetical protein